MPSGSILLVEDSDADARVVTRAIAKHGLNVEVVHYDTIKEATAFLETRKIEIGRQIVLLDLNLPGPGGLSMLRRIKQSEELKSIPVVVWTTSDQERDVEESYANGANNYIVKPMGLKNATDTVVEVCRYWFERSLLP